MLSIEERASLESSKQQSEYLLNASVDVPDRTLLFQNLWKPDLAEFRKWDLAGSWSGYEGNLIHLFAICDHSTVHHTKVLMASTMLSLTAFQLLVLYQEAQLYCLLLRATLDAKDCQRLLKWTWKWQPRLKWPSNVLQGHQKWYQSKASVWFPISSLLCIVA